MSDVLARPVVDPDAEVAPADREGGADRMSFRHLCPRHAQLQPIYNPGRQPGRGDGRLLDGHLFARTTCEPRRDTTHDDRHGQRAGRSRRFTVRH